jgi:hypothetical protein
MRAAEAKCGPEGMHIRSEKYAFPRRAAFCLSEEVLQLGRQAEEVGEGIRHARSAGS